MNSKTPKNLIRLFFRMLISLSFSRFALNLTYVFDIFSERVYYTSMLSAFIRRLQSFAGHANFTCDICGRELFDGERLCDPCQKTLPRIEKHCPFCGRKVNESGICIDCKDKLPVFDRARSAFTHEGEAARLVVRFKRGQKYLYETLSEFLYPLLKEFPDANALTYVPMTEKARKARGYNQTLLLAEQLSMMSNLPLLNPAEKIKDTGSQKFLGRKEREENLKGCFRLIDRTAVWGKRLILVDDTMTTGATLNELSALYKKAGAEKVYAVTVTSVQYKLFPKDN